MKKVNSKELVIDWRKRWYGFWGDSKKNPEFLCPRTIMQENWMGQDKDKIVSYLKNSPNVIVGQVPSMKCIICGESVSSASFDSDGEWLWPSSLTHYLECHDVLLPPLMVEHMRENEFIPPVKLEKDIDQLPWPDLRA